MKQKRNTKQNRIEPKLLALSIASVLLAISLPVLADDNPYKPGNVCTTAPSDIGDQECSEKVITGELFENAFSFLTVITKFSHMNTDSDKFVRPVIIVEGFDIDNFHDWDSHFAVDDSDSITRQVDEKFVTFVKELNGSGRDVIVIDWSDPYDDIRRNAQGLIAAIKWVNNNLESVDQKLVVIGCSMGGLVARYALTYMEHMEAEGEGPKHNISRFISFDSPQQGANIPIGLQSLFWFMTQQDIPKGEHTVMWDKLQSKAARQMLLKTLLKVDGEMIVGKAPDFDEFFSDLKSIGNYPKKPYLLALSDGSGTAIVEEQFPKPFSYFFSLNITVDCREFIPWLPLSMNLSPASISDNNVPKVVFIGECRGVKCDLNGLKVFAQHFEPLDSIPGGWTNLPQKIFDSIKGMQGDRVEHHEWLCKYTIFNRAKGDYSPFSPFVPFTSSIAADVDTYFYNVSEDDDWEDKTWFDEIFYPEEANQPHLYIWDEAREWMLDMINDHDRDGVDNLEDICPDTPNRDQADCNENDIGDVCDTEPCVWNSLFITDWKATGIGRTIKGPLGVMHDVWGETPGNIKIEYKTIGAALDSNGNKLFKQKLPVQVRWCSCENSESLDICTTLLCSEDPVKARQNAEPNFRHSDWHLITSEPLEHEGMNNLSRVAGGDFSSDYRSVGPCPYYDPPSGGSFPLPVRSNCSNGLQPETWGLTDYSPSTECSHSSSWGDWDIDKDIDSVCSFHCDPEIKEYENPLDGSSSNTSNWNWDSELWWPLVVDDKKEVTDRKITMKDSFNNSISLNNYLKNKGTWGRIWVRPSGPDEGGVQWSQSNRYATFKLRSGAFRGSFSPKPVAEFRIQFPWEILIEMNLHQTMEFDSTASGITADLGGFSSSVPPTLSLTVIPVEAKDEIGKFAYPHAIPSRNTALGGLQVNIIDGHGQDARAWAYSTGIMPDSVPFTVDFASARFAWADNGQNDSGIAVFGGTSRNGNKENNLWFGHYDGLDQDGTPFFVWNEAPVNSIGPELATAPAPRSGAAMIFDKDFNSLIVFGGELDDGSSATDVWIYGLENNDWMRLEVSTPELRDLQTVQVDNTVYIGGNTVSNNSISSKIYKMNLSQLRSDQHDFAIEEVSDLVDGPGVRTNFAMTMDTGNMIVYGGVSPGGGKHSDLWQYNLQENSWEQISDDCQGDSCPEAGAKNFILSKNAGEKIAIYGGINPGNNRYYIYNDNLGTWQGDMDRIKALPPVELDCDGDGVREKETLKACRNGAEWYAHVGTMTCAAPGETNALTCDADEPSTMIKVASWAPDSWEGLVDLEQGFGDITYLLTDGHLYTFDTLEPDGGLYPLNAMELITPNNESDWGYDVELYGNNLLVATSAGVHIFDLTDPEAPTEVGFFASLAPVKDLAYARPFVYLAEGSDITAISLADPASPVAINTVELGEQIYALDVNTDDLALMALTTGSLKRLNVAVNPANMVVKYTVALSRYTFNSIRTQGPWTYLSGNWLHTVYYDNGTTLQMSGAHDLADWTNGRILRRDRAERIRWNRFEISIPTSGAVLTSDWDSYGYYAQGDVIFHNGEQWRCLQSHQCYGDPNWAPGIAPSLWQRM